MGTIVDHWVQIVDVTSVTKGTTAAVGFAADLLQT
jgi:hypothetical protein